MSAAWLVCTMAEQAAFGPRHWYPVSPVGDEGDVQRGVTEHLQGFGEEHRENVRVVFAGSEEWERLCRDAAQLYPNERAITDFLAFLDANPALDARPVDA